MGQKMTAVVLDGKHVAKLTEEALRIRVEGLKERSGGRIPVLATVLVGDDPASATCKDERQCLPSHWHGIHGHRTAVDIKNQ